jgi:hypothetical protein
MCQGVNYCGSLKKNFLGASIFTNVHDTHTVLRVYVRMEQLCQFAKNKLVYNSGSCQIEVWGSQSRFGDIDDLGTVLLSLMKDLTAVGWLVSVLVLVRSLKEDVKLFIVPTT